MDNHIRAMADLLGQPVPDNEFLWVRGFPFGITGVSLHRWALCGQRDNPGELTDLDRHEMAHSLIMALSGTNCDPPSLLAEGWAAAQSRDRDERILDLAKEHEVGHIYSLQELVSPNCYHRGGHDLPSVYRQGGPLVHYLTQRCGPATFFRLYCGVRRDSFHDDCRATLGDSWETVEEGFWKWIEIEGKSIARAQAKQPGAAPAVRVELAKSVNPADWQSLHKGCGEANKTFKRLPADAAFVLEGERVDRKIKTPGSTKRAKFEFRAIFQDKQLWIFENHGHDRVLIATPARNADLVRNDSGLFEAFEGRVNGDWDRVGVRNNASDLFACYRGNSNPAHWLPISESLWDKGIYHIERLVRPTEGKPGKWNVWLTERVAENASEDHYQLELDPGQHWWITRVVGEKKGNWRFEEGTEYQRLGDAILPVAMHSRHTDKDCEVTACWQVRPMSQIERQKLKQQIEQAAQSEPTSWLRRLLLAIVIVVPLSGAILLVLEPRSGQSQVAP